MVLSSSPCNLMVGHIFRYYQIVLNIKDRRFSNIEICTYKKVKPEERYMFGD